MVGRRLSLFLPQSEIAAAVQRLAAELRRDYQERHPLLIGILKGSFIFLADLVRALDIPLDVEFIRAASYGLATQSSRRVRLLSRPQMPLGDRHVLVVEDIVDTGLTTAAVLRYLRRQKPASLKLCALLDKPERRVVPVSIDYLGLRVPDRFLVGYGLDMAEQHRHLPDLYVVEEGSNGDEAAHRRRPG